MIRHVPNAVILGFNSVILNNVNIVPTDNIIGNMMQHTFSLTLPFILETISDWKNGLNRGASLDRTKVVAMMAPTIPDKISLNKVYVSAITIILSILHFYNNTN